MNTARQIQPTQPSVYPLDIHPTRFYHPQYDDQSLIIGKIVRVQPNIYMFVCDYCRTEHRSIDSLLRHSEAHFHTSAMQTFGSIDSNTIPTQNFQSAFANSVLSPDHQPMTVMLPNVRMQSNVPSIGPMQSTIPSNQSANDPTRMEQSAIERIEFTASPPRQSDDYIEEVYEITDYGYDIDGKFTTVENAVICPDNEQKNSAIKKSTEKKFTCTFCGKKLTHSISLTRHKMKIHADIMEKLVLMKKSYKCLVCAIKLSKRSHTLLDAEEHMKTHFSGKSLKSAKKINKPQQ